MHVVVVPAIWACQSFADQHWIVEEYIHTGVPLLHELDVIARLLTIIVPALPRGRSIAPVTPERPNVDLLTDLMRIVPFDVASTPQADIADVHGRSATC